MTTAPDHFSVLGLPRRFALSPDDLEARHLARSRESHPDFHQLASAVEQRASLELTAALNDAFATLSDPFRRADYLLMLEGGPSASEHKTMPPDFLEEMLELRMEIEELRERKEPAALARMEQQLRQRRAALATTIAKLYQDYERQPPESPRRKALLTEVRQQLNTGKYIQGQLRDLRAD